MFNNLKDNILGHVAICEGSTESDADVAFNNRVGNTNHSLNKTLNDEHFDQLRDEFSDCTSISSSTFQFGNESKYDPNQRIYQLARNYKIKYNQSNEAYKVLESKQKHLLQLLSSYQSISAKELETVSISTPFNEQDLECKYRLMLDEKDQLINVLQVRGWDFVTVLHGQKIQIGATLINRLGLVRKTAS